MFHITYIKIGVAPISFLVVSNSLILVKCKKCSFRILQILLTASFVIYYYEIYSDSFIHSFIHSFIQLNIISLSLESGHQNTAIFKFNCGVIVTSHGCFIQLEMACFCSKISHKTKSFITQAKLVTF